MQHVKHSVYICNLKRKCSLLPSALVSLCAGKCSLCLAHCPFPGLKQNSPVVLLFLTMPRISAAFCKWHSGGSMQAKILKGAYMSFFKIYQWYFKVRNGIFILTFMPPKASRTYAFTTTINTTDFCFIQKVIHLSLLFFSYPAFIASSCILRIHKSSLSFSQLIVIFLGLTQLQVPCGPQALSGFFAYSCTVVLNVAYIL